MGGRSGSDARAGGGAHRLAVPPLAPVTLEPMGAGWDNTAFWSTAIGCSAFRGARLPCRSSKPKGASCRGWRRGCRSRSRGPYGSDAPKRNTGGRFSAIAGSRGRWPAMWSRRRRARGARGPLARFLRALHDVPLAEAEAWGAPTDAFGCLDPGSSRADCSARRSPSSSPLGTLEDAAPWLDMLEAGDGGAAARECRWRGARRFLLAPRSGGRGWRHGRA